MIIVAILATGVANAQSSSRGVSVPTAPPAPATAAPALPFTPPRPVATASALSAADSLSLRTAGNALVNHRDCAGAARALDRVSATGRTTTVWLELRARAYDCAAADAGSPNEKIAALGHAISFWTRLISRHAGATELRSLAADRSSLAQARAVVPRERTLTVAAPPTESPAAQAEREAADRRARIQSSITEFPLTAGAAPYRIAKGPDGGLWFTESAFKDAANPSASVTVDKIGHLTPNGTFTEFPLAVNSAVAEITAGPDGALWFTELRANKIGRISLAGAITEFSIGADRTPLGITSGPDAALWFTELGAGKIGRITTSGVRSEFSLPNQFSSPQGITAGPDGSLWFVESGGIGRITTAGRITEFPISSTGSTSRITVGPDGALWFTETVLRATKTIAGKIGRISTSGDVTEFPIPDIGDSYYVNAITAGPDGALWFTYTPSGRVAQITTAGKVTLFSFPSAAGDIIKGSDDALWFTELGKIGRITP